MNKLNKTLISALVVVVLVVVSVGTSFAFMTNNLTGDGSLDVINIDDGKFVIAYQGNTNSFIGKGNEFDSSNLIGSKTFSITGTNYNNENLLYYNLSIEVEKNDFEENDIFFILNGKTEEDGSLIETSGSKTKYYLSKGNGTVINLGNGFFSSTAEESVHTYMIHFFRNDITSNIDNKEFIANVKFSAIN